MSFIEIKLMNIIFIFHNLQYFDEFDFLQDYQQHPSEK